MPHKRSKASVRNERRKNINLPAKDSDLNHDAPKEFLRLMRFKEQMQQNKAKKNETPVAVKKPDQPTIQPGERMKDFTQRVENEYRSDINKAHKNSKPLTDRKKRNRQARKEKEANKKQKMLDKYGGRDFDDLKDNVKFGEVADAPPIFKKLPKARGQSKQLLEAKTQAASTTATATKKDESDTQDTKGGYESEEDENMKMLKASHKRKLANMSASAKKALDDERERTISMYRAKKAKKMEDSGLTPSYV